MIVGIDLGTTNSLIAVWRDGGAELIPNGHGSALTPSVVSLADDGAVLVGLPARERLSVHPARSAAAFKRAMGTPHAFKLGKQSFRAEELSAVVLGSLKADAERALGAPVRDAVITVPAYFGEAQRKATRAAGQMAGLNVLRLLNEPTAAALAYGLHEGDGEERRVMVLDLGGGTFDVSILEMFEGVMEVRASTGDNRLGGEDFVDAIMDAFIAEGGAGLPPRGRNEPAHAALRRAAEVAKRALTDADAADVALAHKGREHRWTLTRERFESISAPLLARLRAPIERAIRDAKLMPDDITHLVLAGGATRMPLVRRMAARMFGRLPIATVHPDEVVALGAAVQAGLVARDAALDDRVMTDVAPYTMGVAVSERGRDRGVRSGLYEPVIERNTVIPASRTLTLQTMEDSQREVVVQVYQGEARLVADNVELGKLRIAVPPARAGEQKVEVRFTYDTSGLLEVDVTASSTGVARRLVIENQPGVLTPAEVEQRLAALAHLKVHPAEQAENQAILARTERLYQERLGDERALVAARLDAFRAALDRQDPAEVARLAREMTEWLDVVDTSFFG